MFDEIIDFVAGDDDDDNGRRHHNSHGSNYKHHGNSYGNNYHHSGDDDDYSNRYGNSHSSNSYHNYSSSNHNSRHQSGENGLFGDIFGVEDDGRNRHSQHGYSNSNHNNRHQSGENNLFGEIFGGDDDGRDRHSMNSYHNSQHGYSNSNRNNHNQSGENSLFGEIFGNENDGRDRHSQQNHGYYSNHQNSSGSQPPSYDSYMQSLKGSGHHPASRSPSKSPTGSTPYGNLNAGPYANNLTSSNPQQYNAYSSDKDSKNYSTPAFVNPNIPDVGPYNNYPSDYSSPARLDNYLPAKNQPTPAFVTASSIHSNPYDNYAGSVNKGQSGPSFLNAPQVPDAYNPKKDIGAVVRVLSGCQDSEKCADVHNVASLGLPTHRGSGGACTNALLASVQEGRTSWVGLLKRMQKFLKDNRLPQVPQLSTNRMLDLHIPFEVMQPGSTNHRAVLIGINYVGQPGELTGCHNDVLAMKAYLLSQGYTDTPGTMCILCDDGNHAPPISANIISAFRWLVEDATAGHSLFLHYSGHGGSIPDDNGDEADGMDETLIPVDHQRSGHIRDDDIYKMLVAPLKNGVELTIVMDCCHSGTIIDLPYTLNYTGSLIAAIDAGEMTTLDSNMYGSARSNRVKPQRNSRPGPPEVGAYYTPNSNPGQSSYAKPPVFASSSPSAPFVPPYDSDPAKQAAESIQAEVRMISGCKDSQTSADVRDISSFGLPESKGAGGACTNALLQSVKFGSTTWIGLLKRMQRVLQEKRFKQTPQLSTSRMLDLNTTFEVMHPRSRRHKAVLIGINYTGQRGELQGCHNDVVAMKAYLLSQGFTDTPGTMCILCDDGRHAPPVLANIKSAFSWLVEGASPGDSLFLHYSGHGGNVKDLNGDEADGMDETIVPVDFKSSGQITDDEIFTTIISPLPQGVHFTILMDCCHSGTIIDLPYVLNCNDQLIHSMEAGEKAAMRPNANFSVSRMFSLGKELYAMKKKKASTIQMGLHAAQATGVNPKVIAGMANKMGFKM